MLTQRIKKSLAYSIVGIFLASIASGCFVIKKFNTNFFKAPPMTLKYSVIDGPIKFKWTGDTLNGKYESKTAILFHAKTDGFPHNFWFQFDTGAQSSYIYGNALKSLKEMGIPIEEDIIEGIKCVRSIELTLGGQQVVLQGLRIMENYGGSFKEEDSLKNWSIGTIGSDFISKKVVAINFKSETLQIFKNRDQIKANKEAFHPFDFTGRRIMLPANVDGKDLSLFYDSGCSAFGIITTKNRFKSYRNKDAKKHCYDANSWGNKMPICSQEAKLNIVFTAQTLPMRKVSYMDMYTFVQPLAIPFTTVGGWLGNQPFLNNTLILDTQKSEYAII